jgi:hypothetical protein
MRLKWILLLCGASLLAYGQMAATLPGTKPFTLPQDWQEQQRTQIQDYFERRIEASPQARERKWPSASVTEHRAHLRAMLGSAGLRRALDGVDAYGQLLVRQLPALTGRAPARIALGIH